MFIMLHLSVCVCRTGSLHVKIAVSCLLNQSTAPGADYLVALHAHSTEPQEQPQYLVMPEGSISWVPHKETTEDMQRLLNYILVASMWHLTTPFKEMLLCFGFLGNISFE